MITFEKMVRVGVDRQIHVDVPPEVPAGDADVVVVLNPKAPVVNPGGNQTLWEKYGVLKDSPGFRDDPVLIQRRLRDEWTR